MALLARSPSTPVVQLHIPLSFCARLTHRIVMPIRPEHRWLYPIDWRELSASIRFGRAKGRCERCARPHGRVVPHLGDGRWWDEERSCWRDGRGRRALGLSVPDEARAAQLPLIEPWRVLYPQRVTRVILASAHLDHNPGNNRPRNLAALCQRCHLEHDRPEHRRQRWSTLFKRRAMGDLFLGLYR